jgi:hypothetical protein
MTKTSVEKLPHVWAITTILIPEIESFTVHQFTSSEPEIVLQPIAGPSDEKLPSPTTFLGVNDFVHGILFQTICSDNWTRLQQLSIWK